MISGSWRKWTAAVADYTVGTVIVMIHMATAQRVMRQLPPASDWASDLDMRMKWQGNFGPASSGKGSIPHSS